MLDKVTDIGERNVSLLDYKLIIFLILFSLSCIPSSWMVSIKLQLFDCLANDLLKRRKEAGIEDKLGQLRLIDQMGLDEEVADCIEGHQIDFMLQLIGKFKDSGEHLRIVEKLQWHTTSQ